MFKCLRKYFAAKRYKCGYVYAADALSASNGEAITEMEIHINMCDLF